MALPVFRAAGALGSSATVDITVGAPAGLAVNDIEFLICETMDVAIALTTANGFVEVTGSPISVPNASATIATRGACYWRRWNGSDGDPVVTFSSDHIIAQRFAFSGCITTGDPWNFLQTSSEGLQDTTGSATGNTTTVADCLIAIFIGAAKPDSTSTTEVSGFTNANLVNLTERADNAALAGNGGHIGLATGELATAGASGDTTYTKVTSSYKWHFVVALKPPTGGGGGWTNIAKVNGIASASVAKVNNTAVASIAKVNGVAV